MWRSLRVAALMGALSLAGCGHNHSTVEALAPAIASSELSLIEAAAADFRAQDRTNSAHRAWVGRRVGAQFLSLAM